MNKQCKLCIHNEVCGYKEHYKDAVEIYEKVKHECGNYPYFVCDIRCIKYHKKEVNISKKPTDEEPNELWMFEFLYGDIIKEKTEKWTKEADKAGMTLSEYLESINPLNDKADKEDNDE